MLLGVFSVKLRMACEPDQRRESSFGKGCTHQPCLKQSVISPRYSSNAVPGTTAGTCVCACQRMGVLPAGTSLGMHIRAAALPSLLSLYCSCPDYHTLRATCFSRRCKQHVFAAVCCMQQDIDCIHCACGMRLRALYIADQSVLCPSAPGSGLVLTKTTPEQPASYLSSARLVAGVCTCANTDKICMTPLAMLCLQSQKLQGKSSITRSATLQTRAEKACLDILSRLDADLPVSAIHGAPTVTPPTSLLSVCTPHHMPIVDVGEYSHM